MLWDLMPEQKMRVQKCCELLATQSDSSLPGWSQVMSHDFITAPLTTLPNNDDLQSSVHESVRVNPK
jgi:hypothetical protein